MGLCSRSKSFCNNESRDAICPSATGNRMQLKKVITSADWELQNQRQGWFKIMRLLTALILLP